MRDPAEPSIQPHAIHRGGRRQVLKMSFHQPQVAGSPEPKGTDAWGQAAFNASTLGIARLPFRGEWLLARGWPGLVFGWRGEREVT